MDVSCSTSCIPHRDPHTVEPVLHTIDTDYFELFVFNHWDTQKASRIFAGYPFFSVHGSKRLCFILEEDINQGIALLKQDITLAHKVGASTLVIHAYNSLNTNPDLSQVVAALKKTQKYAADRSITLSIELIPHKTISIPDLAAFFDKIDWINFTFDLEYTSKFQCLIPVLTYVSKVNNVHVRDYDGTWIINGKRRYLKPGDGTSDFDTIFSTIAASGYTSMYTLEAPHNSVKEINQSMKWLTTSLKTHTHL
ncbi:MAG: sugar phosphate isomerase/epimerase [Candidatus Methanofastidiosia archaeon]